MKYDAYINTRDVHVNEYLEENLPKILHVGETHI